MEHSYHGLDVARAPLPPVVRPPFSGSRGGTCHLRQQMHRDHPRHLCSDRPTPPEMTGQPRCCSRAGGFTVTAGELVPTLQRNTPGRRVLYSMRRCSRLLWLQGCLNLDEGSLGQAVAVLLVDGLSQKGSGQKLPSVLGRCPEVLITVVLSMSTGGLR